jgi:transaldolase
MKTLADVGISIDQVTDKLTDDGVRLFEEAFDKLLAAVEKSTQA